MQQVKKTEQMKKLALSIIISTSLAACQNFAEVTTPPQPVNFTNAGVAQAAIGLDESTVRSFTQGERSDKVGSEIVGANCNLQGNGFDATFITPAILQMPNFRGAADPVNVSCTVQGKTGSYQSNAVNLTLQRINQSSGQTSLLGLAIEAAVQGVASAARNPLNDEFGYDPTIGVIIPGATIQ